ncbi:MAG TPA: ribulose-phosphate 3-epimerase [Thermomicrobiales bacterium]|nr:ribulose-phosphate 3-epimerase [Thermomicrobiales bacterium]
MTHERDIWIGPSILSADFLNYGDQLKELGEAGADYFHFDVMDGRFVPNISVGLPVLEATRRGTALPIDVHLMIVEPDRWVETFVDAGADRISFHVEATPHTHRVVQMIEAKGKSAGIVINPGTPLSAIEEILPIVQQVLIMTVNPGFGGQGFIEPMLDKISRTREMIERRNPGCRLQVDGGINPVTIGDVVRAGADMIVAGSSVFSGGKSPVENMQALRDGIRSRTA